MNSFSICLYGVHRIGFTYLIGTGNGLLPTSGPGSDYGQGSGIRLPTMAVAVDAAMRQIVASAGSEPFRVQVIDPSGKRKGEVQEFEALEGKR